MFSEIVCSFFPWGSLCDVISCLAAWSHVPSRGSLSLVPCSFQGVSVQGVSVQRVSDQGVSLQESLSRGQGLCPEGASVQRGSISRGISVHRGVSVQRKSLFRRGLCRKTPPRIRKAGGTHPTEMLSCLFLIVLFPKFYHELWFHICDSRNSLWSPCSLQTGWKLMNSYPHHKPKISGWCWVNLPSSLMIRLDKFMSFFMLKYFTIPWQIDTSHPILTCP